MNRLLFLILLAGCGQTDARLYVEQEESSADVDSDSSADTQQDSAADPASADAESDALVEPDTAEPDADVAEPDAEPDSTEFGPACADIDGELDFGTRILGEEHEEIIRVRNCGDFDADNLVIDTVEIVNDDTTSSDPEFELSGIPDLPFGLLPNEAWPFPVRYAPTEPGEHSAVVRFTTNAPDAAVVDVIVTGSVIE